MEMFSAQFCHAVMRLWKRRSYERLETSKKKNLRIVRLGDKNTRRVWKVRPRNMRLRLRMLSPVKILGRLRDAYLNAMLKLVGSTGSLGGSSSMIERRIPRARTVKESSKGDFEMRLVLEIYKSVAASRNLGPTA